MMEWDKIFCNIQNDRELTFKIYNILTKQVKKKDIIYNRNRSKIQQEQEKMLRLTHICRNTN
jgi:hypothetical protein